MAPRRTINELLVSTRAALPERPGPVAASRAAEAGAVIIDIRSEHQRRADGVIPGVRWYPRNVLEWRFDPTSEAADPELSDPARQAILMCDRGYASSLAAAALHELGFVRATDLDGGFQAWRAAGLPVAWLAGSDRA